MLGASHAVLWQRWVNRVPGRDLTHSSFPFRDFLARVWFLFPFLTQLPYPFAALSRWFEFLRGHKSYLTIDGLISATPTTNPKMKATNMKMIMVSIDILLFVVN